MLFGRRKPAHHTVEYIVFALGNPGARYKDTRHNVGWWVLDELARRHKPLKTEARHKSQVDYVKLPGAHGELSIALVKPTTYMNLSGQSVREWVRAHPDAPWIVVYDDVDLPPGKLRLRPDGSAGGHNGVKSIIQSLGGQQDFARLRLGIGRPEGGGDTADYVLETPSRLERAELERTVGHAADVIEVLVEHGFEPASHRAGAYARMAD